MQNHIDNHKNSMAGQTVLMELAQGDRVQVRESTGGRGAELW